MEKIYLSDAGPKVSPAVYGFWRWNEYKDAGPALMERIVKFCLDQGINTFDHADRYGHYSCEEQFGDLLRKNILRRDEVVLFSKCGINLPDPRRPEIRVAHNDTSASHIEQRVEQSLRLLGTDYLDIFLLDQLDPLSNIEETALTLERLRSAGKIRNIGVSNFTVFQHQLLASLLRVPIVTHHFELNLLNTTALDNGQLDYSKQRFMRPLASGPLAGGRIESGTDKQAVRVRTKLEELAAKYVSNVESVAAAWLIRLGALPLVGTEDTGRIRHIVDAFQISLDQQDWYDLYNTSKGV